MEGTRRNETISMKWVVESHAYVFSISQRYNAKCIIDICKKERRGREKKKEKKKKGENQHAPVANKSIWFTFATWGIYTEYVDVAKISTLFHFLQHDMRNMW